MTHDTREVKEQELRNKVVSVFATFNLGEAIVEREQRLMSEILDIVTTIHHQLQKAREEERERIKDWATSNARTKDTMMSDFEENHEWTVDYHELISELDQDNK